MLYPQHNPDMPAPLKELYDGLAKELGELGGSGEPVIVQAEKALESSRKAIQQLKKWVEESGFGTKEEEIYFFKNIKPLFYSQFLFYQHLYVIESGKPEGSQKTIRKYFKKKLRGLKDYFEENKAVYQYMRQRSQYLDDAWFLREPAGAGPAVENVRVDADPQFSTPKDLTVSEILKNELLQKHLTQLLEREGVSSIGGGAAQKDERPAFQWTATLSGLYELIYSLRRAGAINNGNVTISQLVEFFETFFGVNLKNIYRGHQENRIKQNRTAFLKLLVKKLEEDMDETDDNPGRRK